MRNSIVNIESVTNNSFGTGFVIDNDENGSYILTCKHVLEDVVHPRIEDMVAKVVVKGDFIDMVVLFVSKLSLEALPLQEECCHNLKVEVIGFSNFNQASLQKEHIEATLYKEHIELYEKEGNEVYSVRKIKALDGFNFERGNSGSPVICKKTKRVIAMISNKEGSSLAYAVNIENLKEVWQEVPFSLFEVVVEKIEPIITFIFPWKKLLLALVLFLIFFALHMIKRVNKEWIDPKKEVCIRNGGKVNSEGICYATWKDATEICLVSGGVLPKLDELEKVITDCGGVIENIDTEVNHGKSLMCYKNKGFILETYWTSKSHFDSSAHIIKFRNPEHYSGESYKDRFSWYIRCKPMAE